MNWDIPMLPMPLAVRQALFDYAYSRATRDGVAVELSCGMVLLWDDEAETHWLGRTAMRGWVAADRALSLPEMDCLADTLATGPADFVALSAWLPPPLHPALKTLCSTVHAIVIDPLATSLRPRYSVEVHTLSHVPTDLASSVSDHYCKFAWLDRHARDAHFEPQALAERRRTWVQQMLSAGHGLLIAVTDSCSALAAYMLVPLDSSRSAYGGPVVAGLNGIAASMRPGSGAALCAYASGLAFVRRAADVALVQYQPENVAVARMVDRLFTTLRCTRYDIHWWRGSDGCEASMAR